VSQKYRFLPSLKTVFFFIFHGFTLRVSFKRCSQLDLRRTGQAINRPRRSEGQVHETELFRDRDGR
jgi:hypothetical protein